MLSALGKNTYRAPVEMQASIITQWAFLSAAVHCGVFRTKRPFPIAVYLCDIFKMGLFPEGIWEYVYKKYERNKN